MHDEPPEEPVRTLQEVVAKFEPATDVEDLDTALRLITALRADIERIVEEHEPLEGSYTAYLDSEHDRMLWLLYENKRLLINRDNPILQDDPEIEEVFDLFVEECLEVAWDMAQTDADLDKRPFGPALSA